MKDFQLFEEAKWVIDTLENNNHKAYFVGGSVRDYLMGRALSDVDITTSALPDEVELLFERTIPIGKEHGTIIVLGNNQQYEVTTFRKDGDYVDHRRPQSVQFVTDLYEDVARRDFTMNAIAMDTSYQLHDYFNGYQDIQSKIIRAVGTPLDRMEEDALRIMRGIRFQAQTNFDIDSETLSAMQQTAYGLSHIAIERVIVELKKFIQGRYVEKSIHTINRVSVFENLPFFNKINHRDMFVPLESNFEMWIASLCFIYQIDTTELQQLKISNEEKREIKAYIDIFNFFNQDTILKTELVQLIYKYGNIKVKNCISLIQQHERQISIQYDPFIMNLTIIDNIYDKLPIYNKSDLSVDGKILMQAFNKNGGPWLKVILNKVEHAVILNKVNNSKHEIIEWVREHVEI